MDRLLIALTDTFTPIIIVMPILVLLFYLVGRVGMWLCWVFLFVCVALMVVGNYYRW